MPDDDKSPDEASDTGPTVVLPSMPEELDGEETRIVPDLQPSDAPAPRATEPAPRATSTEPGIQHESIGPFEVEGILGYGGMGLVYRARDRTGRVAAVKVLNRTGVGDVVRRFKREASIRIEHPNIVRVLDAGAGLDGTLYIAFELLEGQSLADRFKNVGLLTPKETVEVGIQVCKGLTAAHEMGVVHRDLKPGNLFWCADGTFKILDFGVAQIEEQTMELTTTGAVVGTPSYLSPEQARGETDIDQRTDIWSLGVLMYRSLSGRTPFRRETPLSTMFAIATEELPPLQRYVRSVPTELAEVIERALRKPRGERWQNANTFAIALENADLSRVEEPREESVTSAERRVVAVILAEGLRDPDAMARAVENHGGRLIPMRGHRAIGLFGGKRWEGDEANRAASAAIAARAAADRMSVASGRAVVSKHGIAGGALRAAEAECQKELEGVAVDEQTARLLAKAGFSVRQAGETQEIIGEEPTLRRIEPLMNIRTVLGREPELAQLDVGLRTVLVDHCSSGLLLTGPPGIGKTTLLEEMERRFSDACNLEGQTSHFLFGGRAATHHTETALALIASLLKGRAKERAGTGNLGEKLEDRQLTVRNLVQEAFDSPEEIEECAPFVGALLGVSMPDNEPLQAARTNPRLMADRVRLALFDYFGALCERGPVCIALDDLQWADRESLELIEELLDRFSDEPLFVLMTARIQFLDTHSDLFTGESVTRTPLRGLSYTDVAKLSSLVADRTVPQRLVLAIADRTAGNPMFVEQIVLELRDRNLIDEANDDLPLPISVEAAVQSRLDHLPREEKDFCKMVAIFGRPFFASEAEALGVVEAEKLSRSLRRRDLIAVRGRVRSEKAKEYRFRSWLVADVAYRMLTRRGRKDLHRLAAVHLISVGAPPDEIATHFDRSGDPDKAAKWFAEAALSLERCGDVKSVLRCSEKALESGLAGLPRFHLHMTRSDAYQFLGQPGKMLEEIESALASAQDKAEVARALAERSWCLLRYGRSKDALSTAEKAVVAARDAGDEETLARALGRQAHALINAGKLTEARSALTEASVLVEPRGTPQRAFIAEIWANLATAMGDFGERRLAFRLVVDLYKRSGDLRRTAGAEVNLADVHNRFGAYAEAEKALRAALRSCRRIKHRLMEGYALINLGYSLTMLRRSEDALSVLDEAAKIADDTGEARLGLFEKTYRARAHLVAGQASQATEIATETAETSDGLGHPGIQVSALTVAASAHLALGEPQEALALSTRALALRDELGGVEEDEAEVFATHGRALEACGHQEEAEEMLNRGRNRLVEVGSGISDPEWRERYFNDVPAHRTLMHGM